MSGPELHAEGYFVIVPEWVLDADVTDKAVRLYAVLRSYADHRTGVAFPGRRTLAARLHVADPKAVDRALAELEGIGAVEVQRSGPAAPGQPRTGNRYLLRHTPRGKYATPPAPAETQTRSSTPGGAEATRGKYAPAPGANTPLGANAPLPLGADTPPPWGRQDPHPGGASAPLTRPRELDPENQTSSPAAAGAAGQLRLVEHPSAAELFDTFWAAYPKKVGKDAARRAWAKAARRADAAKIIDVVRRYPFRSERQFIKDPATWLNAGCWEDDLEAVSAANGPRSDRDQRVTGANYGPRYQDPDPKTHPDAFSGSF